MDPAKQRAASYLAALGVIASLGLVAYELRQNTQAVVGQTMQALAEQHTSLANAGVESSDLRKAWTAAISEGVAGLTEEQDEILSWFYAGVVRVTENRFRQYQIGTLDQEQLLQFGATGPVFRNPYFKDWWPGRRGYHSADFVEFVERELVPLQPLAPEE